jgi:branched-chain amino acid transport system substrate-binding protein
MLGLCVLAFTGCNLGAGPAPIVIGHVSDRSRVDKAGEQAELGIRLGLHKLSKDDAYLSAFGGRKIEVHHTDAAGDIDKFESQAVRLDTVNRCVALLGGLSSAEVYALNSSKSPVLTFHGQPVSGAGNQVFYVGMSPARQGAVLAKVLADDTNATRITFLVDAKSSEGSAAIESLQKTLREARSDAKLPAANFSSLNLNEGTWEELIERMRSQTPNVVVFAGSVRDFNGWYNRLHKDFPDEDLKIVYAGADGDHRNFRLDNDKAQVLLATTYFADPSSEGVAAFAREFREAFQTEPDVHAALAYDGFRLLVEAMKRTPANLAPDRLRDELSQTKAFAGVTGPLTMTPERTLQRRLYVVCWQNGALSSVKAFDP